MDQNPSFLLDNLSEFKKAHVNGANANSIINPTTAVGELDQNWVAYLFPCFELWKKQYGKPN